MVQPTPGLRGDRWSTRAGSRRGGRCGQVGQLAKPRAGEREAHDGQRPSSRAAWRCRLRGRSTRAGAQSIVTWPPDDLQNEIRGELPFDDARAAAYASGGLRSRVVPIRLLPPPASRAGVPDPPPAGLALARRAVHPRASPAALAPAERLRPGHTDRTRHQPPHQTGRPRSSRRNPRDRRAPRCPPARRHPPHTESGPLTPDDGTRLSSLATTVLHEHPNTNGQLIWAPPRPRRRPRRTR